VEQNPIGAAVEYSKMNAELKQATDAGFWTQWAGQTVGAYPLRRLLGASPRGAVFLTEHKAKSLPDAAIKFVRVDARQADPLLEQWAGAATLEHPHLVRLFETGRYQFAQQEFVFVVMEYADQTLAEILRQRALHPDELREMLVPTLEALTFLHRRHLVHLQLKPSNILAVGDQLKLASDTIRPLGQRAVGVTLAYDPPELKDHGITTAGDIWSLGATLVEALTQRTPSGADLRFEQDLPVNLPATLRDTVRRCLSLMHTERPSVIELRSEYKSAALAAPAAESRPQSQVQPQPSQVQPPIQAQPRSPIQPAPSQPQPSLQVQLRERIEAPPAEPRPPTQAAPSQPQSHLSLQVRLRPRVPSQPAEPQSLIQPQSSQAQIQAQPRPQVQTQPTQAQPPQHRAEPPIQAHARPQVQAQPAEPQPTQDRVRPPIQPQRPQPQSPIQAQPRPQIQTQPAQPQPPQHRAEPPIQLQSVQSPIQPQPPQAQSQLHAQARPQVQAQPAEPRPPIPSSAQPRAQSQPLEPELRPQTSTQPAQPQAQSPQPQIQQQRPAAASSGSLDEIAPPDTSPKKYLLLLIVAAALAISVVAWLDFRSPETSSAPQSPVAAIPTPAPVAEPAPDDSAASNQAEQPSLPPAEASSSVVHEVTPTVPKKIQNTIQGRIYVTIRVLVDPAGDVTAALMEKPGPSKYFARLADNAAREWKFAPVEEEGDRVWLLSFRFTRDDVTVRATEQ
jgi:serine/threonine protein kinase